VLINMGENCQLNCVFCRRKEFYNPSSRTGARSIFDQMSGTDDTTVRFSGGGEPTMSPRLAEYMAFARDLGKTVFLETNGLALYDEDYLQKLLESGMSGIALNVMSHDRDIYEKIAMTPGSFPYLVRALENLSEHPGLVKSVSIPLTTLNYTFEHFKEYVRFLDRYLSGYYHHVHCYRPNYTDELTNRFMPGYDELGEELADIIRFCNESGRRFVFATTRMPPCKLKGFEEYAVAVPAPEVYYDFRKFYTHPEGCAGCALKDSCIGVPENYLVLREFTPEPFKEDPLAGTGRRRARRT
jgi:MoaA/NifB/PqqE/SkfB family radical SAM enzyme